MSRNAANAVRLPAATSVHSAMIAAHNGTTAHNAMNADHATTAHAISFRMSQA